MILFLDYDGVLHPDAVILVRGQPVLQADGELFIWVDCLVDLMMAHQEVRIVLSTSWARQFGFSRARDYLPESLRGRVIGATWHSGMKVDDEYRPLGRDTWWDRSSRYAQIRRYVDRAGLVDWLAVDDDAEGWGEHDKDRLIRTDGRTGLSDPGVMNRIGIWCGQGAF